MHIQEFDEMPAIKINPLSSFSSGYMNLLKDRAEKNAGKKTNHYQELIGEIVDPLNASRIESGRKPLAYGAYCKLMKKAEIDLTDKWSLNIFLTKCKNANNYSAFFWWYVKKGYKEHEQRSS